MHIIIEYTQVLPTCIGLYVCRALDCCMNDDKCGQGFIGNILNGDSTFFSGLSEI